MRGLAVFAIILNAILFGSLVGACLRETPEGLWFWVSVVGVGVFALLNAFVAMSRARQRRTEAVVAARGSFLMPVVPLVLGLLAGGGLPWLVTALEDAADEPRVEGGADWEGRKAPELRSTTFDGEPWSLSDHEGRLVVLTFWRGAYEDAAGLFVHLAALRDQLELADSVDFVTVCLDEKSDRAERVLRHLPTLGPALFEEGAGRDNSVAAVLEHEKRSTSTWVFDREGRVLESDLRASVTIGALRDLLRVERFQDQAAPLFATTTLAGETWNLADQRGKVVLIDFWATWCGPCKKELPNLRELQETHGAREDFLLVGISLDEEGDVLRGFLDDEDLPWTHLFEEGKGWQNPVARTFQVRGIPDTWLIDREGRVVAIDLRGEELAAAVEEALR